MRSCRLQRRKWSLARVRPRTDFSKHSTLSSTLPEPGQWGKDWALGCRPELTKVGGRAPPAFPWASHRGASRAFQPLPTAGEGCAPGPAGGLRTPGRAVIGRCLAPRHGVLGAPGREPCFVWRLGLQLCQQLSEKWEKHPQAECSSPVAPSDGFLMKGRSSSSPSRHEPGAQGSTLLAHQRAASQPPSLHCPPFLQTPPSPGPRFPPPYQCAGLAHISRYGSASVVPQSTGTSD